MSNLFATMIRFIKLSYKTNKKFITFLIIDILLNTFLTVFLLNTIKDGTAYLSNADFRFIPYHIVYLGMAIIIISVFKIMLKWKLQLLSKEYIFELEKIILSKTMNVHYYNLELVAFQNLLEKVKFSLRNQNCLENLIEAIITSLEHLTIILTSIFVVSYFSLSLGLLLIILLMLNVINKFIYSESERTFYENLASINREYWYYSMIIFRRDSMLDIKVNKMGNFLDNKFEKCISKMVCFFEPFYKRQERSATISILLSNLSSIIFISFSAFKFYNQQVSFAEFNLLILGMIKFMNSLNSISENVVDVLRYSKYSKSVLDLIDYDEIEKREDYEGNTVHLKADNVSFKYADSRELILKNISFDLSKPKVIVLIGKNGSGKSTLIKIISGLYEVSAGKFTCNRQNIYKQDIASTIFQDFQLINGLTIRENICCHFIKTESEKKTVDNNIQHILNKFSISLDKNLDFDKILGVELHQKNTELSSGQAQLIAILRALYKRTNILMLDEPQSFLDIEKEKMLYTIIESLKREKLIFLVSHKLNAVHIADEVWFMENGQITLKGQHQELLDKSKEYKKLYNMMQSIRRKM